jgi:hypothetical protein
MVGKIPHLPRQSAIHPTPKPVEIGRRPSLRHAHEFKPAFRR